MPILIGYVDRGLRYRFANAAHRVYFGREVERETPIAELFGERSFERQRPYLERALAPTFLFTHGDGWVDGGKPLKVDTKASWIEYVKRRPLPYIYRELDHQQVELHGDG